MISSVCRGRKGLVELQCWPEASSPAQVWSLTHAPARQASLARSWDSPCVLLLLTKLGQGQAEGPAQAGTGASW